MKWYVVGAVLFVGVYLYLESSKNQASNPTGLVATVPSTDMLRNYNGSIDILTGLLNQQQAKSHMATTR